MSLRRRSQRALSGRQLRPPPQGRRDREELCRLAEVVYLMGGRRRNASSSGVTPRCSSRRRWASRSATSAFVSRPRSGRRATPTSSRSARSSRRSGRRWKRSCAGPNRASRASSSRSRARAADRRLDWRDRYRRALRTQGDQRRHHRPCDDGGPRDSVAARRNTRMFGSPSRTPTRRKKALDDMDARSPRDEGHRRALRRRRRTSRRSPSPPNAARSTVQFVALGWKAK